MNPYSRAQISILFQVNSDPKITPMAVRVYAALLWYADGNTTLKGVTINEIADKFRVSPRTIERAILNLEERFYICRALPKKNRLEIEFLFQGKSSPEEISRQPEITPEVAKAIALIKQSI